MGGRGEGISVFQPGVDIFLALLGPWVEALGLGGFGRASG